MKNLIHKILKEEFEEDYSWAEDIDVQLVIVTDWGENYPDYLQAMARLGMDGAKEAYQKFGRFSSYIVRQLVNYEEPENGDICYLVNTKRFDNGNISLLTKLSNGKQFIISEYGYEPYKG